MDASEAIATRLIDKLRSACEPLCDFPESGAARDQLAPSLRAVFAGNYGIYYLHDERELVIVRVLHGARDAVALAGGGGFAGKLG
ncbi:MAG: type II toxin-antitoxin system RelE/ParE family toxin [Beijerinckiaceae bacterium]